MSAETYAKIDALYARLPAIKCQQKCSECCGPIFMSKPEWDRIKQALGYTPSGNPELTCPMLLDGLCMVYDIRPAICRLWGLVKAMKCSHGCLPERWVSDKEARGLLAQLESMNP